MKCRAIFCCLYFGLMPWWIYERHHPHYEYGYFSHLCLNLTQVLIWLRNQQQFADIRFEIQTNGSWQVVFQRMFRWTKFRRTGILTN